MRRNDLATLRPWTARPMVMRSGAWEVVCPSRHNGEPMTVASYLSEEDARLIAAAPDLGQVVNNLVYIHKQTYDGGPLSMDVSLNLDEAEKALKKMAAEPRGEQSEPPFMEAP